MQSEIDDPSSQASKQTSTPESMRIAIVLQFETSFRSNTNTHTRILDKTDNEQKKYLRKEQRKIKKRESEDDDEERRTIKRR